MITLHRYTRTPRPNTGNNPPGASGPGINTPVQNQPGNILPAQNQPGNNPPVQNQPSDFPIDLNQPGNNPPPSSSSGSNQSQILPPMHIPPPSVNIVNNPPPPIVQNISSAPNIATGTHPSPQSSVNLPSTRQGDDSQPPPPLAFNFPSTSKGNGSQPPPPLAFNFPSTRQGVGYHPPPPQMHAKLIQNTASTGQVKIRESSGGVLLEGGAGHSGGVITPSQKVQLSEHVQSGNTQVVEFGAGIVRTSTMENDTMYEVASDQSRVGSSVALELNRLQMELTRLQGQVSYNIPRLPPFNKTDPTLWFAQVERIFDLRNITSESAKFNAINMELDSEASACVRDLILMNPTPENIYSSVKAKIIANFSATAEQRFKQLLKGKLTVPDKPSQLLAELRRLNDNNLCPEDFLKAVFFEYLSSSCRSILAPMRNVCLDELAEAADKIYDETQNTANQVSVVDSNPSELSNLISELKEVSKRLANMENDIKSLKKNQRGRSNSSSQSNSRDYQKGNCGNTLCWKHRKFGKKAKSCTPPCSWSDDKGKSSEN
ncbi:rho GTPase-activating protein gacO-like [Leptopilina boulardi]|uniref:rho GTPase-activating protein gacO-like n=1 Tax=Leptopilina boulardi TaxID=63433 RepID=UPI0021F5CC3F|nr:rho GTPase-activating protein gacO-like [Leptopilina boulardi]